MLAEATSGERRATVPGVRDLLLLRHAKSSQDDKAATDHARPLNLRGQQAAVAMAAAIRRLGLRPNAVLVSSARRTLQTVAALSPWDDPAPDVFPMDALYLAPAANLLDVIRAASPATASLLVVAHNPGLHDLAVTLAGEALATEEDGRRLASGYPSGALAQFSVSTPWCDIGPHGTRLVRFLAPKDLPSGEG